MDARDRSIRRTTARCARDSARCRVDAGTTATYTEIAERLGTRKAVRAVANACAKNPAAFAIPCHRVVRRDGDLGGYRWVLTRKAALLARERDA